MRALGCTPAAAISVRLHPHSSSDPTSPNRSHYIKPVYMSFVTRRARNAAPARLPRLLASPPARPSAGPELPALPRRGSRLIRSAYASHGRQTASVRSCSRPTAFHCHLVTPAAVRASDIYVYKYIPVYILRYFIYPRILILIIYIYWI